MRPQPPPALFGRTVIKIHCLGVGGMGVAPLAIYLSRLGFAVSGEDDGLSEEVAAVLKAGGVDVCPMPPDAELVVHSSAIAASHPVFREAAGRSWSPVRQRQLLARGPGRTRSSSRCAGPMERPRPPPCW